MTDDLQKAKQILDDGKYNCVLVKDDIVYTGNERGISFLVELLSQNKNLSGFSAADTVTGKAAALLMTLGGVKSVYTRLLSNSAEQVFMSNNIEFEAKAKTDTILNRTGDGICIMEKAVQNISDPAQAFEKLKETLQALKNR